MASDYKPVDKVSESMDKTLLLFVGDKGFGVGSTTKGYECQSSSAKGTQCCRRRHRFLIADGVQFRIKEGGETEHFCIKISSIF